ncbi:hypothetical protein CHL78_007700 [Romboutsia weinsteinii]|uniref:DUF2140 family protein n=1 Tax=Romboutsia weinsteinii TaxID=2020949 RepID=A0A371J543_9FIRM|nr:hypothetical protein [Romboutsia weinsteinii]RDY27879.1 hypothetical protein CHL78_007700 [Romboutsia weinsteinii]
MKKKRNYIIGIIILAIMIIIAISVSYMSKNSKVENKKEQIEESTNIKLEDKQLEIFKTLVGLESKEMKIVDNPLRVDGTFLIPQETVLNGVNYYLKTSKNKDIKDVEVSLLENSIKIKAKYNLFGTFKTPVEISVVPSLTKDSDIKLDLKDIKVLNLKINQKLIDSIIDNWFTNQEGITIDGGDVIIDKKNLKGITVKDISIKSSNLIIGLSLKLD